MDAPGNACTEGTVWMSLAIQITGLQCCNLRLSRRQATERVVELQRKAHKVHVII